MIPPQFQLTAPATPLQLTAGAQPVALLPAKCKTTTDAERWASIRAKAAAITVKQTCKSRWENERVGILQEAALMFKARRIALGGLNGVL